MKHIDLLIVDDEHRYADMLVKRLKLRGCVARVCYNGRDAITLIKRKEFHLIVLDLQLPDLYGTEVLKMIKKIRPKTPVIILTGHGSEADREECIHHGAMEFIHKPLDIEALMSVLAKVKKRAA